jgi:hypothetical protein
MKHLLYSLLVGLMVVGSSVADPKPMGPVGPNGLEVSTPLPESLKFKNKGGRDGAGLCVFASITYCARYQNERRLIGLFDNMLKEPGGGYPEKVDAMIKKYGPGTQYIQDTTGNYELLKLAIKTGRPCGVTFDGHDPHYGNRTIAHMVQLVYADDNYACISDNNFPEDTEYEWMTKQEFITRWKGNSGGWCVILLNPGPPPVPHN